ncbi:ABC transporter substrate-binding protein [Brachybacterium sp. GCM10030252]|uniref:ABC transporter substrate-binding protein n=1 Tax=Brachybacterium sp. GCM10030252 TaxID=3273380 RepID=UPI0036060E33
MTTRRTALALLASTTAAAGLAACSEPADPDAAAGDAGASDAGGGESTTITLYTSEPQAKIDELIAAFNEEHPEITVETFRAGTGDLKARIDTEKETGAVGADVLIAADAPTFEGYKAEDLLAPYEPAEEDALLPEVLDADGYYVGTRIIPTVIMVNTNEITEPPTSWQELTGEQYRDQLVMPNPDVSGAAAYNAAVWLADDQLGEAWLSDLAANNPVIAESNGPTSQAVAEAAQPVGIVVDYLVRDLAAEGSPVEVSYPSEGVPYISQPGAIFADSQHPEAAATFLDFVVSTTGQELAVAQSYLPVREDAGTPEGAPAMADIALMTPEADAVTTDQQAAAVDTFNGIMGG